MLVLCVRKHERADMLRHELAPMPAVPGPWQVPI